MNNSKTNNYAELDKFITNSNKITLPILNNIIKRPGREIKIPNTMLSNDNVTAKIGTVENRNEPNTVFITVGFWVDIKEVILDHNLDVDGFDKVISKKYSKYLKNLYKIDLKPILEKNNYFPFYYENIYLYEFPENINYNHSKRCYTYLEFNLHTLNSLPTTAKKYPLKNKNNSELFDECINVINTILKNDLFKNKLEFKVHKKKK